MSYPLEGIAPGYLIEFLENLRRNNESDYLNSTTADIFSKYVLPATKDLKVAYTAKLAGKSVPDAWQEEMQPAAGISTHFISHAWGYKFRDFARAVLLWIEQNLRRENKASSFLWIDIFSVNQHTPKPEGFWDHAFAYGVKTIGHTVLVIKPPLEPTPLKRIWCNWEIFNTVNQGIPLSIAMEESDKEFFTTCCDKDVSTVIAALSSIDIKGSNATVEEDKIRILGIISQSFLGIDGVNKKIKDAMLSYLLVEVTRLGKVDDVRLLLCLGADPNTGSCPAIHEASYEGMIEIVRLLVSGGCNPDLLDSCGWTPISCACENGHFELVKFFVEECKVNLQYRDWDGNRPLENAQRYGQLEIVKYLSSRN